MFRSRKRIKQSEAQLEQMIQAAEKTQSFAFLVSIEREGRLNKFLFRRNGQLFQVETMGLISDDIPQWKKDLLR